MNLNVNISIIDSLDGFRNIQEPWAHLEESFCLSHPWLMAWWEKIGSRQSSNQLCLIKMEQEGEMVGIAPLYTERNKVFGRTLKLLGSGAACSDMMTFPAKPGFQRRMGKAVFETIRSRDFTKRFGSIDLVELEGHLADDPAISAFVDLAKSHRFAHDSRELEGCWRVEIPRDWEDFRKLVKKSQRRKINKVDSLNSTGNFETIFVETPTDFQGAWADFVDLHQKRRNQLGQPGCFASSEFNQFLYEAVAGLSKAGRAMMTMIKHQGKPIGAVLSFASGDCLCVYQSGLDNDSQQFEPGHFANAMTFRGAQERGFKALDFLRGDERYKSNWGCTRSSLFRTRLVAPTLTAQFRHRVVVGGRQLKNVTNDVWNWSIATFSRSRQSA